MRDSRIVQPLHPELHALLESERGAGPPQAAALDRVWERVARSTAGAPAPSGKAGAAGAGGGWLASRAGLATVLAFVGGVSVGAAGHAVLEKPETRVVYVDRAVRSATPPAPVELTAPPEVAIPRALSPKPLPPHPVKPAATATAAPSSLAAEREVLDRARSALTQNDGAGALALTDVHVRRFPKPELSEEREAIAIQALVLEQRNDEARARAEKFRRGAPNSLFLPAVEASLASIP